MAKTKQPDRFARMVERRRLGYSVGGAAVLRCDDVEKLLRRQHAAYVKMVKQTVCAYANGPCEAKDPKTCVINRAELLTRFKAYRKGTS